MKLDRYFIVATPLVSDLDTSKADFSLTNTDVSNAVLMAAHQDEGACASMSRHSWETFETCEQSR